MSGENRLFTDVAIISADSFSFDLFSHVMAFEEHLEIAISVEVES
jgi:hypothetical protein